MSTLEDVLFHLQPEDFPLRGERELVESGSFKVVAFRFPSAVEGLRIENTRGHLVVLPFLGQMIWDALFDGRRLTMGNVFPYPRHGSSILETYGAFAYHAGVLRNGTPGPQDTHPLHGEMPVRPMDSAHIRFGHDNQGAFLEVGGHTEYVMGFGPHYIARPRVRLRGDSGLFDVEMVVENRSAHEMELMYMLHANFAFVADAEIHQPAPYTPESTVVRKSIPGHVTPSQQFMDLLEELGRDPRRMQRLAEPELYSPEQVFYIKGLGTDGKGRTRLVMELPERDAFSISYRPEDLPHCVRWILNDGDAQVAAFALPSTCEPEGYTAEKAKGHLRMLAPGETARFPVTLGYLSPVEAGEAISVVTELNRG